MMRLTSGLRSGPGWAPALAGRSKRSISYESAGDIPLGGGPIDAGPMPRPPGVIPACAILEAAWPAAPADENALLANRAAMKIVATAHVIRPCAVSLKNTSWGC